MPSGRYPYPRPFLASQRVVFATGTPAGVSRVGGIVWFALRSRHMGTRFSHMCSPTVLPDIVSLRGWTGHLRRTVWNPLRSDRFLFNSRAACHLTVGIPKLGMLSDVEAFPSDGAYPRRERRGIAPVQRIMFQRSGFTPCSGGCEYQWCPLDSYRRLDWRSTVPVTSCAARVIRSAVRPTTARNTSRPILMNRTPNSISRTVKDSQPIAVFTAANT